MKKTLTMILSLALVAALSIAGTLAYLTDKDNQVTNTFTVGAGVSINLDEAKVNPDGTPVDPAERVTENTYKLVPGATYTKDPTVTVTGDDCLVFVSRCSVSRSWATFPPGSPSPPGATSPSAARWSCW